jgi:hypothetical protein
MLKGLSIHFRKAEPQETAQVQSQMKLEKLLPTCVMPQMTQFGSMFGPQIPHPTQLHITTKQTVNSKVQQPIIGKVHLYKLFALEKGFFPLVDGVFGD